MAEIAQITRLLARARKGDRAAEDRLLPLVYVELRRIAAAYMRRERQDHTLQATALVHEAYIKLLPQRINWESRSHFLGVAAQQMRRILVDHARQHNAAKRHGNEKPIQLDEALAMAHQQPADLVALHEALELLAKEYGRQAKVVELRFFGGRKEDEIAQMLRVSVETVKRDWRFAKAWLNLSLRHTSQS